MTTMGMGSVMMKTPDSAQKPQKINIKVCITNASHPKLCKGCTSNEFSEKGFRVKIVSDSCDGHQTPPNCVLNWVLHILQSFIHASVCVCVCSCDLRNLRTNECPGVTRMRCEVCEDLNHEIMRKYMLLCISQAWRSPSSWCN